MSNLDRVRFHLESEMAGIKSTSPSCLLDVVRFFKWVRGRSPRNLTGIVRQTNDYDRTFNAARCLSLFFPMQVDSSVAILVNDTFRGVFEADPRPDDPEGLVGALLGCIRRASTDRDASLFVPDSNGGSLPGAVGGRSPGSVLPVSHEARGAVTAAAADASEASSEGDGWSPLNRFNIEERLVTFPVQMLAVHVAVHPETDLSLEDMKVAEGSVLYTFNPTHLKDLQKTGRPADRQGLWRMWCVVENIPCLELGNSCLEKSRASTLLLPSTVRS